MIEALEQEAANCDALPEYCADSANTLRKASSLLRQCQSDFALIKAAAEALSEYTDTCETLDALRERLAAAPQEPGK